MTEITDLQIWIKTLSPGEQDRFFRLAAGFFSSQELSGIIKMIKRGYSLYTAHEQTGVFSRHIVDLIHLQERWPVL